MGFRTDLGDSCFDFERVVWPVVCPRIGGGELLTVEGHGDDRMRKSMDVMSGIDSWQVSDKCGMRGIASRNQWIPQGRRAYESFTIRGSRESGVKTELDKRIDAISNPGSGWLYPHLTVQAYIEEPRREGRLISLAITKTVDLFDFFCSHRDTIRSRTVKYGGVAEFYPVFWNQYRQAGYRVSVWRAR